MADGPDDDGGDEVDAKTLLLLLTGYLGQRVATHPISTLGGVAAVGYALGWSLPKIALRMGGAVMMRVLVVELLDELLVGGTLEVCEPCGSGSGEGDEPRPGARVVNSFVS